MKFLMSRNDLSSMVVGLQAIVAQRPPMPILSNILVVAEDDRVTFTATDLTVSIRCTGSAKVSEPGSTAIPAKRFAQLLRELHVSYIEVSSDEKEINEIITESSVFRLHGMPPTGYPALPGLQDAQNVRVKQGDLKTALFRTSFAVSKEDTRYALTGLSLSIQESTMTVIGTDGKRMARATLPIVATDEVSYNAVLPVKAVDEIARYLTADASEDVTLYFAPDRLGVETDNCLIITKLLSGDYPEVERVIPNKVNHVVSIHKDELGSLLRQIVLFITEDNPSVRLTLDGEKLQFSAMTSSIGEGSVSMVVNHSGVKFEIAFNPFFLLDILKHSKEEYIYMGYQDSFNPIIFSDVEFMRNLEILPSSLFILMPLRLGTQG